jgi:hypothetical protein
MQIWRCAAIGSIGISLAGCIALDAPPLDYQCPHDLRFTAHLYRDVAMLDGMNGHAVLARQTVDAGASGNTTTAAPLRYADDSVRAEFGLGVQGRLVRLDYTNIPEPVYCTRTELPSVPVIPPHAVNHDGPRPPPPAPDPNAPRLTNLRTRDGRSVRAGRPWQR